MKFNGSSRVSSGLLIALTGAVFFATQLAHATNTQHVVTRVASNDRSPEIGVQVKIETFTADDARAIARAGFAFVRFGIWTNNLSNEAYLRHVQSAFGAAEAAKLPVLLTMRSTEAIVPMDNVRASLLEAAGEQFARSVRKTVEQHTSLIKGVELWNEPDLSRYWPTRDVITTFPAFMRGVCDELTSSPLPVPVFAFGFARAPIGDSMPGRLLRAVVTASPGCVNIVSYHAYGMTSTEMQNTAAEMRSRYGLQTAITEWGVPTSGSRTTSPAAQARKFNAFLASADALDTPLISIYEWKESQTAQNDRERSFGLIGKDGKPKPAFDSIVSYFKGRAASS